GEYSDASAKKCAPAFPLILHLHGYFIAAAVKLHFDKEATRARLGHTRKFCGHIGPAALPSRAHNAAPPETMTRNSANSVNRSRLRINEPATNAERTRVTHYFDRI